VPSPNGLFLSRWYAFFLGVLVWGAIEDSISSRWLYGYIVLIAAASILLARSDPSAGLWNAIAVVAAIAIHLAGTFKRMDRWLVAKWIQFLGKISYSLYLLHLIIGSALNGVGVRICHGSPPLILLWIAFSVAVCIGSAYVMYRLVELPSLRWAHRLRYDARRAT
jgi:peptidoglycan/LPS O-acetylase OafA/YrhL